MCYRCRVEYSESLITDMFSKRTFQWVPRHSPDTNIQVIIMPSQKEREIPTHLSPRIEGVSPRLHTRNLEAKGAHHIRIPAP